MLQFITWNADPIMLDLGAVQIRWYGLMFAIGFWLGTNIVAKMFRHEGARRVGWVPYSSGCLVALSLVHAWVMYSSINGITTRLIPKKSSLFGKADSPVMVAPLLS